MKTAGVVIDSWKLEVFKKHLLANAYTYEVVPGPYKDTLAIKVQYTWVHLLQPVIAAANKECADIKRAAGG